MKNLKFKMASLVVLSVFILLQVLTYADHSAIIDLYENKMIYNVEAHNNAPCTIDMKILNKDGRAYLNNNLDILSTVLGIAYVSYTNQPFDGVLDEERGLLKNKYTMASGATVETNLDLIPFKSMFPEQAQKPRIENDIINMTAYNALLKIRDLEKLNIKIDWIGGRYIYLNNVNYP